MSQYLIITDGDRQLFQHLRDAPTAPSVHCGMFAERGKPETCGVPTVFLIDADDREQHMVGVCREHVPFMYDAFMRVYGSATVHHYKKINVPKWGTETVAPDALPEED